MFKRRFLAILFMAAVIFPGAVSAQEIDPEKHGLIREVLEITKSLELFETMKTSSIVQFERNIEAQSIQLTPEQMTAAKDVVAEVFESMREDLFLVMIDVYHQNYTEEELAQMLAFYKTDLGQMFINKLPKITDQILMETNKLVIGLQPVIQSKMTEAFQALEKKDSES